MTQSLPGAPDLHLEASRASTRWPARVQDVVTNVGAKAIPWIPTPAKRVMFGGRAIIIDGNTLDPTLQLMLSGLRLGGIDGLTGNSDPVAPRAQTPQRPLASAGPQIPA